MQFLLDCRVLNFWGSDEFLPVCLQTGDVEADELVRSLKRDLAATSDDNLTLSVSFGACTVADGEAAFDEAFKAVDEAMFVEKQAAHAADARGR